MQVRGVMIPALDPNPGLDFQLFVDSGSSKSGIVTTIKVLLFRQ